MLYYPIINQQDMKYAFIIGTNAFIVPSKVISYTDGGEDHEFLRINSIYQDLPPTAENDFLDIDLHIKDTNGTEITLQGNKKVSEPAYLVTVETNSIKVFKGNGDILINVHQLDTEAAMGLEHNIVAELGVHDPVVVIRISGEFFLGDLHIRAENEKLLINDEGYATSAMVGKNQLVFTDEGVVI